MQYKKTVILKNNEECLIRNAQASDAEAVCENIALTRIQTDFLMAYADEDTFGIEEERQFLDAREQSENEIELCAIVNGRIVGVAGMQAVGNKDKIRHRAAFGIGIEEAYWGRGIGRALISSCIACARQAGYSQLELNVVAENTRALSLYQSIGFIEYGRNPRGFCSRYTGWQELILMRMEL